MGIFGLERSGENAMELRRMYVALDEQRGGVGRMMLGVAEAECRRRGIVRLELSTSELQPAALAFYRDAGYALLREKLSEGGSNKVLGAGIRRYYFEKSL